MIIPLDPRSGSPSAAPTAAPSETSLLMALAEMQKQGRIQPSGEPVRLAGDVTPGPWTEESKAKATERAKDVQSYQERLRKAMGKPPITPPPVLQIDKDK